MVAFLIIFIFLSIFQVKLFNKLTPLEEGTLKDRITALCDETGYPAKKVCVSDDSKRSTKANAFFTGFGRNRIIVLSDNLIRDYTEDEILCVTAHEIGHAKGKHLPRRFGLMLIPLIFMLVLAYFVVNSEATSLAFGFSEINVAFAFFIAAPILTPFMPFLMMPMQLLSKKHEYESDSYALKYVAKEPCVSMIKKIARLNYANLTPHPIVVKLFHSHPTISQRVTAFEKN
jgi:STE24 endopeptidase